MHAMDAPTNAESPKTDHRVTFNLSTSSTSSSSRSSKDLALPLLPRDRLEKTGTNGKTKYSDHPTQQQVGHYRRTVPHGGSTFTKGKFLETPIRDESTKSRKARTRMGTYPSTIHASSSSSAVSPKASGVKHTRASCKTSSISRNARASTSNTEFTKSIKKPARDGATTHVHSPPHAPAPPCIKRVHSNEKEKDTSSSSSSSSSSSLTLERRSVTHARRGDESLCSKDLEENRKRATLNDDLEERMLDTEDGSPTMVSNGRLTKCSSSWPSASPTNGRRLFGDERGDNGGGGGFLDHEMDITEEIERRRTYDLEMPTSGRDTTSRYDDEDDDDDGRNSNHHHHHHHHSSRMRESGIPLSSTSRSFDDEWKSSSDNSSSSLHHQADHMYGIHVVDCSQEWEGFDESSSWECSHDDKRGFKERIRRVRRRLTTTARMTRLTKILNNIPNCCSEYVISLLQLVRVVWFVILYVVDFIVKYAFLAFLWRAGDESIHGHYVAIFWCLLPFQVLTTILCIVLSLADDDIYQWRYRNKSNNWCVIAKRIAVIIFLGLFQFINVQKVLSKYRAQVPTIINEVERHTPRKAGTEKTAFLKRQGTARINLNILCLTGVPYLFAIVHCTGLEWSHWLEADSQDNIDYFARMKGFILFVNLGCFTFLFSMLQGIVEIDCSVSWYVKERFHFKWGRAGSRVGKIQFFYPFVHIAFRLSEMVWRVTAIAGFGWGYGIVQSGQYSLAIPYCLLLVIDIFVAFFLLARYSSSRFQSPKDILLYIVCSLILYVANVVHFVDRPGFAIPARRITSYLTIWRFIFCCITIISSWFLNSSISTREQTYLWYYAATFFISASIYWVLYASVCRMTGYDLHVASEKGHSRGLMKMFNASDPRFPVPDIDARTKDGRFDTALHLAAKNQQLAAVEILIDRGASVNLQNYNGNTPLHVASRATYLEILNSKAEADERKKALVKYLLEARADPFMRNYARQRPIDLASESLRSMMEAMQTSDDLEEGMYRRPASGPGPRVTRLTRRVTPGTGAFLSRKVIRECNTDDLEKLFPHLHDRWVDETFMCPPVARRNIGSLIFHEGGAGLFDADLLPTRSQRLADKDLLYHLRTVEIIGQGGFGTVVKVEDTAVPGTFYAIKLQQKSRTWRQASLECEALQRVAHPHIVSLEAAFQTPTYYALLIEYCCTDMNRKVLAAENDTGFCIGLPREDAMRYGSHMLSAIAHLHAMNIAYRDVKPENVLLSVNDDAKLADFGLARGVPENSEGVVARSFSMSGTLGFLAPEGLFQRQTTVLDDDPLSSIDLFAIDIYAFGMTLQIMLCGEACAEKRDIRGKGVMLIPHFEGIQELLEKQCSNGGIDEMSRDLLISMIQINPVERARTDELKAHPFFRDRASAKYADSNEARRQTMYDEGLSTPVVEPSTTKQDNYNYTCNYNYNIKNNIDKRPSVRRCMMRDYPRPSWNRLSRSKTN